MDKTWAGVDAGKEFHRAHVLDASGKELLSRKVQNDEDDLLKLIDEALSLAVEVIWAVDQPGGGAALLLALLWERGQEVAYVPGLSVDRARDAYRGESKTDRKDARVIAYPRPGCGVTWGGWSPGMMPSPGCNSSSPGEASATSWPTGPAPSRGSGRRSWPSSR